MKQITPLLFFLFCCLINPLLSQNLTFHPADVSPGEKFTIEYNKAGTPLQSVESFDVVVYQFTDDGIEAKQLNMDTNNELMKAAFETSDKTKALFVTLSTDDGKHKDNNGGKGYVLKMKTADKSTKVPGAYTNIAHAFGRYYRTLGLERDYEKALKYVKKEFKKHPALKKDEKYLKTYATYAARAKNEAAIADVKGIIESLEKKEMTTEAEMMFVADLARNVGEKEKGEAMVQKIVEKYPEGKAAMNKMMSSFYQQKDLAGKLKVYNEVKSKYGDHEKAQASLANYSGRIAMDYARQEDWDNFEKYFANVTDPVRKAGNLNSLAWTMSGESLDAEPSNAKKGAELSLLSLELLREAKAGKAEKPASMTEKQWNRQLDYSYGMYSDTYALLQYHTGNYDDAFKFQKIAGKSNKFKDGEMNESFCVYAEKAKGPEKAEKKLQWFIKEGNATSKMKEQYQRVFMANNTLETAYEKHMAALESVADDKKREELKGKMINEDAPDFQLVNLKGEQVNLSQMKGKVVVLDFWATWCGPCKASFPGMQKAVDKYSENDQVEFLFLDTWERGKNKEENASKFINDKGYTFNVVMDNDNKVVEAYKVSGIPTKFVVDKNGKIRFKSVGFGGSDDGLVSELSMMIEMAEEVSTPKTTSTP